MFDDLVVVELGRYIAGPYCCQLFGDLGADVIKVEGLTGEPGREILPLHGDISLQFFAFNRNKRSIAVDLRTDEGKKILARLIERADVFVANFRPGVLDAMGFSAEDRKRLNPSMVDVTITGFGPVGPYSDRAAYDEVVQADSGLMSLTGFADGPPTMVGTPIIDCITGLYAFAAALAGLQSRSRTGVGTQAHVSMFDSAISLVNWNYSRYLTSGVVEVRKGNSSRYYPGINTYAALDGYVQIIAYSDDEWRAIASEIGGDELANDERFTTEERRQEAEETIDKLIEDWVGTLPAGDVVDGLTNAGVLATRVRSIMDVATDPEMWASGRLLNLQSPDGSDIPMPTGPIRFSEEAEPKAKSPPAAGQDTVEILRTVVGATDSQIESWRNDRVVGGG